MKRSLVWLCALCFGLGGWPGRLSAQSPDSLFAAGVRAYRDLEFHRAAGLLRRALARQSAAGAPAIGRNEALVYLGAADLFRGRSDSAVAVFRRLIMLDPRYRPDRLVFPPEVTSVFDSVRVQTKTVVIVVPRDTEIAAAAGSFPVWLVASSFQIVDVTLRYEDGAPFRSLYAGPIGDSLYVPWDGLDASGAAPPVRRVVLRVASRAPSGELGDIVQLPLDLRIVPADTLDWPPAPADSQLLPERAASGPAVRSITGAIVLSGAIAALPALVGGPDVPSRPRLAVAGAVGIAGVLGYILHRPGRPLPDAMRANQAVREAWLLRVTAVKGENVRRLGNVRLAIHAGQATAIQPRGP